MVSRHVIMPVTDYIYIFKLSLNCSVLPLHHLYEGITAKSYA
jgi:hypothetical protein